MEKEEELKLGINNVIWMYAKGKMTLEEAEKMSCYIMQIVIGIEGIPKDALINQPPKQLSGG